MSEKLTDADEQLAELFFQCARYERPSTDWKEALLAYKRSLAPVQEGTKLSELLVAARDHKMTPDEIFEQKVSFIWGMQKLSAPGYSKEQIREMLTADQVPAAPVQEGKEPTADMIHAGAWALSDLYAKEGGWCGHKAAEEQAIITWKAMQAAAPHKEGS